jgi:hypothetical protein
MPDLLKASFFYLLFNVFALIAFGQEKDSLKTVHSADSLKVHTDSLKAGKFTPDTVYIINGDIITGNILSYQEGRLRIDAQSAGVINIRNQKIYSISGGSRLYYLKDTRNVPYIGNIRSSKDTGEIRLSDKLIYEMRLTDIASFRPIKNRNDTSEVKSNENKKSVEGFIPDTIFLKNLERYTGRIISLEQGRIKMDAQGAGIIFIKWNHIITISGGNRIFKVQDLQGEIYIGQIETSRDTGEIQVIGELKHGIMMEDIGRIFPLEEEWYRGFKGSVGGGFNYTKSSEVLNINFDYNLYYVFKRWRFINNFSYLETSTSEDDPSVRISVDLQAIYSLRGKWVLAELSSFNRNDELGILSRISFGTGGGYNVVLTDRQRLLALSGILQNTERNIESNTPISNFEFPVTLYHTVYSFIRPDLTSTTEIAYYKGITESARYRVDVSTDITWEFIKWTKLKLTFYYNFDNKQVEGKESEDDYGTVISLLVDLK